MASRDKPLPRVQSFSATGMTVNGRYVPWRRDEVKEKEINNERQV